MRKGKKRLQTLADTDWRRSIYQDTLNFRCVSYIIGIARIFKFRPPLRYSITHWVTYSHPSPSLCKYTPATSLNFDLQCVRVPDSDSYVICRVRDSYRSAQWRTLRQCRMQDSGRLAAHRVWDSNSFTAISVLNTDRFAVCHV